MGRLGDASNHATLSRRRCLTHLKTLYPNSEYGNKTWINDLQHNSHSLTQSRQTNTILLSYRSQAWKAVYPSSYHTDSLSPRSIILVNNRLNTNHWKQIPVPSNDITAIQLTGPNGTLAIFNIYN